MSTHRSNIFCVATANVGTHRSIQETISYLENLLESASNNDQGPADVLVLPETCIPGYTQEQITQSNHADIENALKRIQDCCKRQKIGCVLGIPNVQGKDKSYNSAVLIDRYGRILGYQNKMQLVPADVEFGKWCYGEVCNVFHMDSVPVGILICHDKRFPELARLMVLGGARVLFYISCEQWHDDKSLLADREPKWSDERLMKEIGVYRAQVQARAVENNVWIVKSNVARDDSHGHSGIINPLGHVVAEAGFEEELIVANIDISEASASYARKSLLNDYQLSDWWRQGVDQFVKWHPSLPPPMD